MLLLLLLLLLLRFCLRFLDNVDPNAACRHLVDADGLRVIRHGQRFAFRVQQITETQERQELGQRVFLYAARYVLQQHPHELVASLAQLFLGQLVVQQRDHLRKGGELEEDEVDDLARKVVPQPVRYAQLVGLRICVGRCRRCYFGALHGLHEEFDELLFQHNMALLVLLLKTQHSAQHLTRVRLFQYVTHQRRLRFRKLFVVG